MVVGGERDDTYFGKLSGQAERGRRNEEDNEGDNVLETMRKTSMHVLHIFRS